MTDKTTEGITAEPEEVEAVLLNLCGYHLAERDPAFRYTVLTREQVLYDALVTAIKRERGRALAEMVANGHKLTEVAELTGLGTRQRVQRLIQLAKVEQAVAEVQAASREFDERLAAVEATLDEVVSGLIPVVPANVVPANVFPANVVPANEVTAQVDESFDEVTVFSKGDGDTDDLNLGALAMDEPTRMLPTLLRTSQEPDVPWWRRSA
jgi:hypothetical protein